jgi:endonuclease/exonuclease/phosphatase family metal-dependent hydrolase
MSIGIGSARTDTAALERQLQADLKALQEAQKAKASAQVLAADQARVQQDELGELHL